MITSRTLDTIQTWPLAVLLAIGLAAFSGALTGLAMPYGPASAAQAMLVLLAGLAVGLAAGWLMGSRWALLLAPLAYITAVELARMGAAGATVDGIRLDTSFGILALLLGRGFHGLVGILPMLYGASLGAALARQAAGQPDAVRALPTVIGAALLAGLALLILLPARTPPILNDNGQPVPGSIAELATVRIGGHDQALLLRGHSADNPVLLYLSGGPGQSDLPYSRVLFADLAQDFVVVSWDQRGTGKSYAALHPASTLTLDRAVSDVIEVTEYLRQRFGEEKIYLLGESWGSTLGVLAAQRRPDLYHGIIGSGQMVSQRETDRRLYGDLTALAAQRGDDRLASRLADFGEPPYRDLPYANGFVMGYYEALYQPYTPPAAYIERGTSANLGPWGILGSEYSLVEKVNVLRGLLDMFTVLYPQLQGIDFRQEAPRLETPVYILDGAAELSARRDLALEWFGLLDAPIKRIFTFDNAGHSVAFEQFEPFHRIMVDVVVPETYPGR